MKLRHAPRFTRNHCLAAALFFLLFSAAPLARAADTIVVSFGATATPCAPFGTTVPHLPSCQRTFSFSPMAVSSGISNTVPPGKPVIQDYSFSKLVDSSSTTLLLDMLKGTAVPQMLVAVYRAADLAAGKQPYYKVLLKNVRVTSITNSDSLGSAGLPAETVSVAYALVQVTYTYTEPGTASPETITYTYNRATNATN